MKDLYCRYFVAAQSKTTTHPSTVPAFKTIKSNGFTYWLCTPLCVHRHRVCVELGDIKYLIPKSCI